MPRAALLSLIAGCLVLASTGPASAVEGFRGSTWGDLRWDLPASGEDNLVLKGWVRQGVDWTTLGFATVSTYATVRYGCDTQGFDWNNSIGPGVGVALDAWSSKGIAATLAVEFLSDRFYETGRTENKAVVYLGWYGSWNLKK